MRRVAPPQVSYHRFLSSFLNLFLVSYTYDPCFAIKVRALCHRCQSSAYLVLVCYPPVLLSSFYFILVFLSSFLLSLLAIYMFTLTPQVFSPSLAIIILLNLIFSVLISLYMYRLYIIYTFVFCPHFSTSIFFYIPSFLSSSCSYPHFYHPLLAVSIYLLCCCIQVLWSSFLIPIFLNPRLPILACYLMTSYVYILLCLPYIGGQPHGSSYSVRQVPVPHEGRAGLRPATIPPGRRGHASRDRPLPRAVRS